MLLGACAATPAPLTPIAVLRQAKALEGQRVQVRGYLTDIWAESHGLFETREILFKLRRGDTEQNDPAWRACVTLLGWQRFIAPLKARKNQYVVVTGTIRTVDFGNSIHWDCSDTGIVIESVR